MTGLLLALLAPMPVAAVAVLGNETPQPVGDAGRGGAAVSPGAAGAEAAAAGSDERVEGLLMVLGSLAFTVLLLRSSSSPPVE